MSDAEVVTYEQKVECLEKIYYWFEGFPCGFSKELFLALRYTVGHHTKYDSLDIEIAAIYAKQYDLVILREDDGWLWIGDYETIKEQVDLEGFKIVKVY